MPCKKVEKSLHVILKTFMNPDNLNKKKQGKTTANLSSPVFCKGCETGNKY
jgi:hypothetical protein